MLQHSAVGGRPHLKSSRVISLSYSATKFPSSRMLPLSSSAGSLGSLPLVTTFAGTSGQRQTCSNITKQPQPQQQSLAAAAAAAQAARASKDCPHKPLNAATVAYSALLRLTVAKWAAISPWPLLLQIACTTQGHCCSIGLYAFSLRV